MTRYGLKDWGEKEGGGNFPPPVGILLYRRQVGTISWETMQGSGDDVRSSERLSISLT